MSEYLGLNRMEDWKRGVFVEWVTLGGETFGSRRVVLATLIHWDRDDGKSSIREVRIGVQCKAWVKITPPIVWYSEY